MDALDIYLHNDKEYGLHLVALLKLTYPHAKNPHGTQPYGSIVGNELH